MGITHFHKTNLNLILIFCFHGNTKIRSGSPQHEGGAQAVHLLLETTYAEADYYPAAKDEDCKDRDEEDDVEDDERDKNLENPWSPMSCGEICKRERHFSTKLFSET